MKHRILTLTVVAAALLVAAPAFAHQPRISIGQTDVAVDQPEVSKAYYGILDGTPVTFTIHAAAPFDLYANILVPDVPGVTTTLSALVSQDGKDIVTLEAPRMLWQTFYEEFAGDTYLKGPEYRLKAAPAGTYTIVVSSPDLKGPYVLAIGETEAFPPGEMLKALWNIPRMKMALFHKSPFAIFEGIIGHYLLITLGGIMLVAAIILAIVVKARRKKCHSEGKRSGRRIFK